MKILLAIDGSPSSNEAITEILERPWPENSEVRVITAYEMPVMVGIEPWAAGLMYFEELQKATESVSNTVLENALTKLKSASGSKLRITGAVVRGPAQQVITEEAERWSADLIVMGSRGLGAWNRLLLGSVSNAVVHHAKCSVEIVRRDEQHA